MRPSLLSVALVCAFVVPACANGSGRNRVDAHVASPDTGPRTDASMPGHDAGTAMNDTGGGPGNDAASGGNDAGPRDSGIVIRDAFVPDTGGEDTGCTSAAACSDGIACNGVERCVGGACMPGTAVVCDDGLTCTTDGCFEPSGTCGFSSTCPTGQTCGATGCTGGTGCAESPCRLSPPQCGCATGQGCYVVGASRACLTSGSGTAGTACAANTDCAPGNDCINFSTVATSVLNMCAHFCTGDADCSGGLCIYTLNDGTGGTVPGATLCTHPCDPVMQTGCASGAACDIFQESMGAMRLFTDCTGPRGTAGQFATCTTVEDCRPGFACVDTDGFGSVCHHWCRYPGGACPGGSTCTDPFTNPTIIGGQYYGICD